MYSVTPKNETSKSIEIPLMSKPQVANPALTAIDGLREIQQQQSQQMQIELSNQTVQNVKESHENNPLNLSANKNESSLSVHKSREFAASEH